MNLEKKLIDAAENGDTKTVALLLGKMTPKGKETSQKKPDKGNQVGPKDQSAGFVQEAIERAAYCGHTKTVELLLKWGANPHANGNLSLCWAAGNGHTDTVALLLEKTKCKPTDLHKPLMWAAEGRQIQTVALLLRHCETKEITKWAMRKPSGASEMTIQPLAQKEYKKRMDCIKAQKIRDSEPEIIP
jgi:ankyrin repeat protein